MSFWEKGIEHAKKAVADDSAGNHTEALRQYTIGLEYFLTAIKYENNEKRKQLLKAKVAEYLERAEALKAMLTPDEPLSTTKKDSPSNDDAENFKQALKSTIVGKTPNVKWTDIAGLEQAKEALKEAVVLPVRFPRMFTDGREPWKGILLYGPPGTGKSYLAKAVATEAKSAFFSVSSADLISKWQGESEKLVKALFEMAREQRPSVIFIDEVDSLCSARGDGHESESSRRIKTQFLTQMEGVGNEMGGVLILAATNTPWSLDLAIRRRFDKRIYIALPSKGARRDMFKIHLGTAAHDFTGDDLQTLADATENYSGSDIKAVVREALMMPVRITLGATHFKQVVASDRSDASRQREYWTPCSPGDADASEKTLMELDDDDVILPKVSLTHLRQSIVNTRPTVSDEDIKGHVAWTQQFGQDG